MRKRAASTTPISAKRAVRCAIYTRKSSEEGLEQDFNSLDAQREACEAYVSSQRSEGWVASPTMYDDGGFSGGTLERPALKRLLADIAAGLVDTVVVYKVDRLTRSLADFAKIVEIFDAANVSFVSVTQSFNTTTSMGRLTLNMLLSFAQFEREVTGERIRDKIAASKAKGMWMGGRPSLGYEIRDRELVIIETEAETVRHIFRRYVELKSVLNLRDDLAATGVVAKRFVSAAGKATGGGPLDRGALYHMLGNRLYRGEIAHKGQVHLGRHPAIVDEDLWNQVQAILSENRVERGNRSDATSPSLLAGLLHDEDGIPLTPTHADKKGRRYRYYVSHDLIAARAKAADGETGETRRRRASARRVPAGEIEAIVENRLIAFLGETTTIDGIVGPHVNDVEERRRLVARVAEIAREWPTWSSNEKIPALRRLIRGITVKSDAVEMTIDIDGVVDLAGNDHQSRSVDDGETTTLIVPAALKRVGLEMRHLVDGPSPAREPDRSLLRLLAQAHRCRECLIRGDKRTLAEMASEVEVGTSYFARVLRLGFLAPDITTAIVEGRQPIELSAIRLAEIADLPNDWKEQRRILGFA